MLSMRSFTRSAPRALSRMAAASMRQSAARPAFVKATTISAMRPAQAAFSTSGLRRATANETDEELVAKLESEVQIEEEMKAGEQQPASVKDFLKNSPFELIDTPGQETVKLVRDYKDEKITVSFSIADIANFEPENYSDEIAIDPDHPDHVDKPRQKVFNDETLEAQTAPYEQAELEEEEAEMAGNPPIMLNISIEKPGKSAGALQIEMTANDGNIWVENMFFYEDAKVANSDLPEPQSKRVYPGPPFGTLDEDLQVLIERYLEERGINTAMAIFVPDYVDVKEQREYMRWLNNVKAFVEV